MRKLLVCLVLAAGCAGHRSRPATVQAREAPQDGTVRFIAVGDTGMGTPPQYKVAEAMARVCAERGCDFIVLLGDNIYRSGVASADDPQWKSKFEDPYAALQLPFWAALGNHDYGNQGIGNDFDRPEGELEYARKQSRFRLPARRYHFAQGPAEFFVLDSNAARWGRDPGQAAEVSGWFAASKAPWKIAVSHFPYRSNGPHGNAGDYEPKGNRGKYGDDGVARGTAVKELLEASVCGKADLYFAGHDHSRQWLREKCGGSTELLISGGGVEATPVTPRNPAWFEKGTLGFVYVSASATELQADFVDEEGKTEFTRTLRKPAP